MITDRNYTYTKLDHVSTYTTINVYGVVKYCGKVSKSKGTGRYFIFYPKLL